MIFNQKHRISIGIPIEIAATSKGRKKGPQIWGAAGGRPPDLGGAAEGRAPFCLPLEVVSLLL